MTAGNRNAGARTQMEGAEIHHRRWHQTKINDIATSQAQTVNQGLR